MYEKEREILKNPLQTYKKLAIPLIIYAIFDAFYMLIDTFWASFMGIESVVAVGISVPIFTLIVKLGTTLGQGTNSYMSQSFGECNPKKANNTLLHGIIISITVSILIPLLSIPFLKEILGIFNYHDSITQVIYYLIPILICAFVFILNGVLSETIQSEGDSKRPTLYIILGNVLNLFLSPILAFKFGLGVMGLSIGTIIGNIIPLIIFINIYRTHNQISSTLSLKEFNANFKITKEIMKVTLPNFIDRSLFSFLAVYANIILTIFAGPQYIATYILATNLANLIQSPARGSARGILTITGHLYGAKKINKLKKIIKYGLIVGIVLSIITSIILISIHDIILPIVSEGILKNDESDLIIIILVIINLIVPISFVVSKILDGFGKSIYSLVGTIIKIVLDMVFIAILALSSFYGWSVGLGILCSEIVITFFYLFILKIILNKIKKNISKA